MRSHRPPLRAAEAFTGIFNGMRAVRKTGCGLKSSITRAAGISAVKGGSAMDSAPASLHGRRMKFHPRLCLFAVALIAGCGPSEIREGPKPPPAAAEWMPSNPAKIDFQAFIIPGGLEINEDGKPVSRVRPAQPVIERWSFVKEGRQIIVKSRGAEGPPTIELFDSRTAVLRDSIPEDQVRDGRPAWAAGFVGTQR